MYMLLDLKVPCMKSMRSIHALLHEIHLILLYIYRSSDIQYLELFLATTVFDQNGNISTISLSMDSELMLEEPLYIASVITFGIEGDCILEELMVNASIDEIIIYGNIT